MPNSENGDQSRAVYFERIFYFLLLFFVIPIKIDDPLETKFKQYLQDFNKSYDNSTVYQQRLDAFKNSLHTIDVLNSNQTNGSAQYGLTKYSDMPSEEFLQTILLPDLSKRLKHKVNNIDRTSRSLKNTNIPQKIDWREKNVVSKVATQSLCGACWAFAAIGVIESMHAIKMGKLENLSVQAMIDCAKYNNGCEGGDVCSLLYWMKTDKVKIAKEADYPLTLNTDKCKNVSKEGVQIEDFVCENFEGSEHIILELLVRNGPVAVAINAQTWQHYIGGTIQFHCDGDNPLNLNHAVEIVGYDLTGKVPHYIVRNSWGEDFGDNGYLYIEIGKNLCGLAHEVSAIKLL